MEKAKYFTVVPDGVYTQVRVVFNVIDVYGVHYVVSRKRFNECVSSDSFDVRLEVLKDDSRQTLEVDLTAVDRNSFFGHRRYQGVCYVEE